MRRATPQLRKVSERLVAHEAQLVVSSGKEASTAFPACERLRQNLSTLLGNTGYRALLSRALALASAEVAGLRRWKVEADGTLRLEDGIDSDSADEGQVVLVAQLLGLLVAFIGQNLAYGIVREVWPRISLNDLESGTRESS